MGFNCGLLAVVRGSMLRRTVAMLQAVISHHLKSALVRWDASVQILRLDCERANVQESHFGAVQRLHDEFAQLVSDRRKAWRSRRDALIERIGEAWTPDGISVHKDNLPQLRKLDKQFAAKIEALEHHHTTSKRDLEVQLRHRLCIVDEHQRSVALLPLTCTGRLLLPPLSWPDDDFGVSVLLWAFSQQPEPWMLPFKQMVAIEEQRNTIAAVVKRMFALSDEVLQLAHAKASLPAGRHSAAEFVSSRAAACMLKNSLQRAQQKGLRIALQRLKRLPARAGWHGRSPRSPARSSEPRPAPSPGVRHELSLGAAHARLRSPGSSVSFTDATSPEGLSVGDLPELSPPSPILRSGRKAPPFVLGVHEDRRVESTADTTAPTTPATASVVERRSSRASTSTLKFVSSRRSTDSKLLAARRSNLVKHSSKQAAANEDKLSMVQSTEVSQGFEQKMQAEAQLPEAENRARRVEIPLEASAVLTNTEAEAEADTSLRPDSQHNLQVGRQSVSTSGSSDCLNTPTSPKSPSASPHVDRASSASQPSAGDSRNPSSATTSDSSDLE